MGTVGLGLGLGAAFTTNTLSAVLAVLAGVAAFGTGALALLLWRTEHQRQLAAVAATELAHRAELDEVHRQLVAHRERVQLLERSLEERDRTAAEEPLDDPTTALTDPDSRLFSEAYFRVALDARIASARRHLRPVAVALIEVFEGLAGPNAAPAPPERAAESIRQTVRDADTACRLSDGVYAIILEDTPENGAVWTVERVRRNLVSRFGSHTMWAGVACYPAHAFSTEELLTQARSALDSAREWKQDRIEVAISE
jgi:diguanylate cyclase (GGDEF)-like protein